MKITEFNALEGAPGLPDSVLSDEGDNAINGHIAKLIMHAAKVERADDNGLNEFRWSVNEEMEFRGTIVTGANVAIG